MLAHENSISQCAARRVEIPPATGKAFRFREFYGAQTNLRSVPA
jgi:hypothetical protein